MPLSPDESSRFKAVAIAQAEADAKTTQQRRAFANTFDRLVESNVALTTSVSRLVVAAYILAAVCTASTALSALVAFLR